MVTALVQVVAASAQSTEPPVLDYEIDPSVPIVDPEGCPRNREEAAARGRQCLRKCASDADCISTRKRCLCDGLCGWSCIRPDLHCAELGPMDNGQFKVTGDHFGARVMYSCTEGYWMSGPKERVCQGDGSWSEHGPECRQKAMCGIPPQVPHARHNATEKMLEFDVDDVVQYTCFQGYDPHGFPRAKCLFFNGTTQWYGLDLRCIPISCDNPGEVENGRREGDIFTFTSRVTYQCDAGYELVGRANRYCESKGEWSGVLPSCRPVQCPHPKDVSNGRVVFTSSTYKSVARYECLHSFRLVGPTTRTCEANKKWEGEEPYCEEIKCGDPGILHNGYVKGSSTRFGTIIYFSCLENMTFVGESATTTCQEDGTWSHSLPKCMAPCSVPSIHHGRVTNHAPSVKVGHGKHISVDCIAQYELRYNTTPASCNNGSWTHIPKCIPARCKSLPLRPRHGMVIAPKTDHGRKALFRCKDGFQLTGPNVTECSFGRWTGGTPLCNETYCPFPGVLQNGRILLVGHMGMYDYRPYVKKITNNRQIMYECDRHYTLDDGPPGATCVDGRWSPQEKPNCIRGSHPNLRFDRDKRDTQQDATPRPTKNKGACVPILSSTWMEIKNLKRGVVQVRCHWGYTLNIGKRTARCVNGQWKPKKPECISSPCELRDLPNGFYVDGYRTGLTISHGSFVRYDCNPHFLKMTSDAIQCWQGTLRPEAPKCIASALKEQSVPSPNHTCVFHAPSHNVMAFIGLQKLAMDVAELQAGVEIVYRCVDIGKYYFEGSIRRRCVAGQWTGSEPICLGLDTLGKPTISFEETTKGRIAQSNDGKLIVYPGTVMHLKCLCREGAARWEVSHTNREFPEGWTEKNESPLEHRLTLLDAMPEDSGIFTCVTPSNQRHSVEIVVSAVHCPRIPQVGRLVLSSTSTKMNEEVVFSCEPGYKLVRTLHATCLPSGQWSVKPPKCIKVLLCPYPGTTKGATLSSVKFYYKISETIVFGCREGYKVHGRTVLQCMDAGRWSSTVPTCHPVKKG